MSTLPNVGATADPAAPLDLPPADAPPPQFPLLANVETAFIASGGEFLERRAVELGFEELHLDTATNQPEAVAFYENLGYSNLGEETRPEWTWTLVYFGKSLS
jgi:hypothetical protein